MATEVSPLEAEYRRLIARLDVWQETKDPCEDVHVEHTANDHFGRRLVHSMSPRGFGADWEVEAVELFIREASVITEDGPMGHAIVAAGRDGKRYAFQTKKADR